jgi:hypothetical protein
VICAFKHRNISIRKEIIGILRQNLMNDRMLRESGLVSAPKVACSTFGVQQGVKWAFERRNISIVKEVTVDFRQKWMKDRILRESGLVSALKVACTTFGV